MIITLDGPAGAGKSTIARRIAERLSLPYLDTGALYRTVGLAALRRGIDPGDENGVAAVMGSLDISYRGGRIFLDSSDVSEAIRTADVTDASSRVAVHSKVRQALLPLQRSLAGQGAVADGRDMGTVVFPDADLKIYLDASEEERARRRWEEFKGRGRTVPQGEVLEEMRNRDLRDSLRKEAPLKRADGAVYVDTTGLSIEEVVERILCCLRERSSCNPD